MAGAGFEDFDGRRGVAGGGGDVDVEEGDDGGCVEGVDLLHPNGVGVSRLQSHWCLVQSGRPCQVSGGTYGSYQPADFSDVLLDCGEGYAILCTTA